MASTEFESIFGRLRSILQKYVGRLSVAADTPDSYCLEGPVGPATLRAWKGKARRPMLPVAWVGIGKAYVSFHLMGLYGNQKLQGGMSKELKARMQGKTCFNFKNSNEALFKELEQLTARGMADFRKAGFIAG
ncbi:MAG TPA: hypothetical protein VGQ99_16380 [Tepidisphaeraceae bacterium]|jgi:hypothetical protein|nr:hypothetical protein [Tepidisphaeraceae bacterium]HEV8606922.1 hypothetical protein [Tepidisphaeraceae bacterium]